MVVPKKSLQPTIRDVAAKAGVSKSLASLALRGDPRVAEPSRRAVTSAAERLGYRPNAMARSLGEGRTNVLGVLVEDLHNPFFADVFDGIQERAQQLGFRALLSSGNRRSLHEELMLDTLLDLRVDGLILLSQSMSASTLRQAAASVPVAVIGKPRSGVVGVDLVDTDDVSGMRLAVEHLAGLGHSDVAFVAGPRSAGALGRRRAFSEAVAAHDDLHELPPEPAGDVTEASGAAAGRRLLERSRVPTAVVAMNDQLAIGVLGAVAAAGLEVGRDLSVIGYDNSSLSALPQIALTTLNQPRFEIGQRAVTSIHARVAGARQRVTRTLLQPALVVRGTTGAPRS